MSEEAAMESSASSGKMPFNPSKVDERKGKNEPANNLGHPEKRARPRRNKKRPRSEIHSNNNLQIKTTIQRLEMEGRPILDEAGAEQFLRVIHPYPYTFSSFAKQRWVGRTILDVYVDEFGSYPESYYKAAIQQGRILVSDNMVDLSYRIKGSDILTHIVHRHEPGVAVHPASKETKSERSDVCAGQTTNNLIKVIDETDDLIILDKPGTLPIHPCGGYHLNSLTSILEGGATAGQTGSKFFNIHRLDRLTSGLVVLAKSPEVAKHWSQCIRQRDCEKYYLARVRGKFPMNLNGGGVTRLMPGSCHVPRDGEFTDVSTEECTNPIEAARRRNAHGYWITDASGNTVNQDVSLSTVAHSTNAIEMWLKRLEPGNALCDSGESSMHWLHLACPTRISKPKDGVCEAGMFDDLADDVYLKTVKPAQTSFGVVSYDGPSDSTLLLCRPVTGRTHQIRLHCQYLGHPIANDPNYGGDVWYGNGIGKAACAKARLLLGNAVMETTSDAGNGEILLDRNSADVPASKEEVDQLASIMRNEGESLEEFIRRTCVWCTRTAGRDAVEHSMLEFLLRSRGIWLHALQYCIGVGNDGPEHDGRGKVVCRFRTEPPTWARF